ncbi:MAG: HAD family hydrolase [Clostridia bacterium]|nr:HAD family hydrolase [Clostridia bacterium]
MKYKYIMWDWNGTILDDLQINFEIENTLLSRRGKKTMQAIEEYHEKFGFPIISFYEKLGFDLENEKFEDIARDYVFEYDERFPEAEIFPDAEGVLREFKFKGLRQMILSATEQKFLEKQVRAHDIDYLFTDILGTKDVYAKSKVDIALRWISENDIDSAEVLFVGDTTHDFEVAENIGCDCVLIARGHNSYDRLLATGATVLEDIEELRKLVLR